MTPLNTPMLKKAFLQDERACASSERSLVEDAVAPVVPTLIATPEPLFGLTGADGSLAVTGSSEPKEIAAGARTAHPPSGRLDRRAEYEIAFLEAIVRNVLKPETISIAEVDPRVAAAGVDDQGL